MELSNKIYVAGHHGMVGSVVCRALAKQGYTNVVTRTHKELDLLDSAAVRAFYEAEKPDVAVIAAARVGGMELYQYVTPMDVSFSEIAVQEVPCFTYEAVGYFTNSYFNGAFAHTGGWWGAGAGRWSNVKVGNNRLKDSDMAAYEAKIPWLTPSGASTTNPACAWTEGHAYMDTPLGWNVKDTSGNTPPYKQFGENLQQVFRIDRHGRVGVFKLDNWVERTTNGVVTVYGPKTEKDE